jgi:hypothetical protein
VRLEIALVDQHSSELTLDDDVGLPEPFVYIALTHSVPADVASPHAVVASAAGPRRC